MDKRLVLITGHYGSGKTEFAVNYAIECSKDHHNVRLADLDIVNPYFRSREREDLLKSFGIRLVGNVNVNVSIELPALPPEIRGAIEDSQSKSVIDVGGDPIGARVLARYSEDIKKQDYDMFLVVNANRPETQNKDAVIKYIKEIEFASKLKITGLVNNTHLLKSTSKEDVYRGHRLVEEVSIETHLPIKYDAAIKKIAEEINSENLDYK